MGNVSSCYTAPAVRQGANSPCQSHPIPAHTPASVTPSLPPWAATNAIPGDATPQAVLGTPRAFDNGGGTTPTWVPLGTPPGMRTPPRGMVYHPSIMQPRPEQQARPGLAQQMYWDRTLHFGPFPPEVFKFFEDNNLNELGVLLLMCGKAEIMPLRATTGDIQRTDRDIKRTPCGQPVTAKLLKLLIDSLKMIQVITVPELAEKSKELIALHQAVRKVRECVKLLVRNGWIALIASGRVTPDTCSSAHQGVVEAMTALGHDMASVSPDHADWNYSKIMEPVVEILFDLGGERSPKAGCQALRERKESRENLARDMGVPQEAIDRGVIMHVSMPRKTRSFREKWHDTDDAEGDSQPVTQSPAARSASNIFSERVASQKLAFERQIENAAADLMEGCVTDSESTTGPATPPQQEEVGFIGIGGQKEDDLKPLAALLTRIQMELKSHPIDISFTFSDDDELQHHDESVSQHRPSIGLTC